MSLLSQFLPKKETKEYFLTLGVEEHRIVAAVAFISGTDIEVKGIGESDFSAGENETEAADIAISTAEKNLPENTLVEKVVFALPVSCLEGDTVKSEYLTRLKKITQELSLHQQGFIEYPAALSFYFEKEEGSPPTALILSVEKTTLTLSLIRVGKVQQNVMVIRTSSLLTDFEEAISQFTTDILPSRIIMYDHSEKMETMREELLRFSWHKHASFLHTPKIEILSHSALVTSLVEAAGSTFLNKTEHTPEGIPQTHSPHHVSSEESIEENVIPVDAEAFGFVKEKSIHHAKQTHKENIQEEEEEIHQEEKPSSKRKLSLPSFKSLSFPSILPLLPIIIPFVFLIIIIALSSFYLFWVYPKTQISLIIYPLIATEQIDVTFTTDAKQVSSGKNVILATLLSNELSGEKTASTTGKAKVGDKAKGEVTLYNKTLAGKTFPKGTAIQNGDIRFTLDEDASIASASDTGEGLTFGKASAPITATSIGPEGNLTAGSIFTFKDFPESAYTSKNPQGLAGGTSREVPSVSLEDQKQLENSLTQELLSRAKQELIQKLSAGSQLVESSLNKSIVSKKWSKDAGSEAQNVTLSLDVKITALSYKQENLISLGQSTVTQAPLGFTQDTQKTYVKVTDIKEGKQGTLIARTQVNMYFTPNIDTQSIKSHLKGKTYDETVAYVQTVEHVAGVKIFSSISLPFLSNRLPLTDNNIDVSVVTY